MLLALTLVCVPAALVGAQMPAAPVASAPKTLPRGPLSREMASKLVPATVFFAGQVAPVQARNTGGAKLPDGLVLAGLVDTSGYSTGVQERYQAYLLLDTPAQFGGKLLQPGAYGCGIVSGQFLVLDLSAKQLFSVPAQHDAALARPTPLQVLPETAGGAYRLYLGRNYVSFGVWSAPAHADTAR
jgi:hypothetical protein